MQPHNLCLWFTHKIPERWKIQFKLLLSQVSAKTRAIFSEWICELYECVLSMPASIQYSQQIEKSTTDNRSRAELSVVVTRPSFSVQTRSAHALWSAGRQVIGRKMPAVAWQRFYWQDLIPLHCKDTSTSVLYWKPQHCQENYCIWKKIDICDKFSAAVGITMMIDKIVRNTCILA